MNQVDPSAADPRRRDLHELVSVVLAARLHAGGLRRAAAGAPSLVERIDAVDGCLERALQMIREIQRLHDGGGAHG